MVYEGCCMEDAKAVVGNREINPKNVAEGAVSLKKVR